MNDLVVVQKIAGWEKLKALVLDSVSSPITKGVYSVALDEYHHSDVGDSQAGSRGGR
jgi:hypothetical protein